MMVLRFRRLQFFSLSLVLIIAALLGQSWSDGVSPAQAQSIKISPKRQPRPSRRPDRVSPPKTVRTQSPTTKSPTIKSPKPRSRKTRSPHSPMAPKSAQEELLQSGQALEKQGDDENIKFWVHPSKEDKVELNDQQNDAPKLWLKALPIYQSVLENYRKLNDRPGEASTLWRLGNLYVKLGTPQNIGSNRSKPQLSEQQQAYYAKALEHLERTFAMSQEMQDSWLKAKSATSIVLIDHGFLSEQPKFRQYLTQAESAIIAHEAHMPPGFSAVNHQSPSDRKELMKSLGIEPEVNSADDSFVQNSETISEKIKTAGGEGASFLFDSFIEARALAYEEALKNPNLDYLKELFGIETVMMAEGLGFDGLENGISSESEKQSYADKFQFSTSLIISFHQRSNPNAQDAAKLAFKTILMRKGMILDVVRREKIPLPDRSKNLEAHRKVVERAYNFFKDYATYVNIQKPFSQLPFNTQFVEDPNVPSGTAIIYTPLTDEQKQARKAADRIEGQKQDAWIFVQQVSTRWVELGEQGQRDADLQGKAGTTVKTSSAPTTDDWIQIQQSLPSQSALVEFVKYRPYDAQGKPEAARWQPARYAAYLLLPDGQPQGFDLGSSEEIDGSLTQFRQLLNDPTSDIGQLKTIAQNLETKLLRPIRAKLGNTRKLFLSPDAQLNLLPFEALVDEQNKYLVENYSISYLSSGRDLFQLKHLRTEQPKQNALIIADPDFSSRPQTPQKNARRSTETNLLNCCDRLEWTTKEAANLQQLMPEATVLTQQEATKEAIQQAKAPQILHIATHGFFLPDRVPPLYAQAIPNAAAADNAENPLLRSGLALAGFDPKSGKFEGALSALEVRDLDLLGTELVVLSACQTGVGEIKNGEGVYGLRRAFFTAEFVECQ
jgi:CHAT domain-containing protein